MGPRLRGLFLRLQHTCAKNPTSIDLERIERSAAAGNSSRRRQAAQQQQPSLAEPAQGKPRRKQRQGEDSEQPAAIILPSPNAGSPSPRTWFPEPRYILKPERAPMDRLGKGGGLVWMPNPRYIPRLPAAAHAAEAAPGARPSAPDGWLPSPRHDAHLRLRRAAALLAARMSRSQLRCAPAASTSRAGPPAASAASAADAASASAAPSAASAAARRDPLMAAARLLELEAGAEADEAIQEILSRVALSGSPPFALCRVLRELTRDGEPRGPQLTQQLFESMSENAAISALFADQHVCAFLISIFGKDLRWKSAQRVYAAMLERLPPPPPPRWPSKKSPPPPPPPPPPPDHAAAQGAGLPWGDPGQMRLLQQQLQAPRRLPHRPPTTTNFAFGAAVSAFHRAGEHALALRVHGDMVARGVRPSEATYGTLCVSCARGGLFHEMTNLIALMSAEGMEMEQHTARALVKLCAESLHPQSAAITLWVFRCLRTVGFQPTTAAYSTLFCCIANKQPELAGKALKLAETMRMEGVPFDADAVAGLIKCHDVVGQWQQAEELLEEFRAQVPQPELSRAPYNGLLSALQRSGQWQRALHWFTVMSTEAAELEAAGRPRLAEALAPDVVTYNALISACEKGAQWKLALQVFGWMPAARIAPNTVTVSALISALEKGGQWRTALRVFNSCSTLNVEANSFTYNALITACARGGEWGEAMRAFSHMRHVGVRPDISTYNPLLNACWGGGQAALAQALMKQALRDGVYSNPITMEPGCWSLDMHQMSAGAALASVVIWLLDLQRRLADGKLAELPARVQLITGWGKHSRIMGESEVRTHVTAMLMDAGSPFEMEDGNPGAMSARGAEVQAWLAALKDVRVLLGSGVVPGVSAGEEEGEIEEVGEEGEEGPLWEGQSEEGGDVSHQRWAAS